MTNNEIIKALGLCSTPCSTVCRECPYHKFGASCKVERNRDALALINRQRAEIEDLSFIVFTDRSEAIKNLKSETIKEFAERLKNCLYDKSSIFTQQRYIVNDEIDKLVKEMTGGGTDGRN